MKFDIALDLGSRNTRICLEEQGVVLNEPSVVALDLATNEIIAYGDEAYAMVGRTSERIMPIFPIERGVITDFDITTKMVKHFLKKSVKHYSSTCRLIMNLPEGITGLEEYNLMSLANFVGIKKVKLIESCKAAAMGAGFDVSRPKGRFVVAIGAGITNLGMITLGNSSKLRQIKLGGDDIDEEIIKYMRKKYSILIGKRMAEDTKIALCDAREPSDLLFYKVKGRSLLTGLPAAAELSNFELLAISEDFAAKIAIIIQESLDSMPPEIMSDISADGIILTGGASKLKDLGLYISTRLGIKVVTPDEPELCIVKGELYCGKE